MNYIQGISREQILLMPKCVDEYVNEDNAVRVIDIYVDSLDLNALGLTKVGVGGTGRPPYVPQDQKAVIVCPAKLTKNKKSLNTKTGKAFILRSLLQNKHKDMKKSG